MSIAHYYETMDYGPAPEADGEARAWLKRHDATFGHFTSGKFVAPVSGKHLTTIEPATGKASEPPVRRRSSSARRHVRMRSTRR